MYVRCIFIDYSRAFDTINHEILIRKLLTFAIPHSVIKWIVNFLSGRTQAVISNGKLSTWLPITQSIVQGSGIGPLLYIILASDLKLLSQTNRLCKYADDTTLILPQKSDVSAHDEFNHVVQWSIQNKLVINFSKTKEVIFRRPGLRHFEEPTVIDNIERLNTFKLLGVFLSSTLSMDAHVNFIISIACQRLFLIGQLKKQGLPKAARRNVFQALVVSRLTYALAAFAGFLSCGDIARLNAVFRKAVRWDSTDCLLNISDLIENSQTQLFKQVVNNFDHCLHQLLPEKRIPVTI
jgi:ribonuclease P/MRP protein subunit RPP40